MTVNPGGALRAGIFIFIALYYSYVTTYYATLGSALINPKNLFLLLGVFSLFGLAVSRRRFEFVHVRLTRWLLLYAVLFLLWYVLPTNYLLDDEFRKRFFALVLLGMMTVVISFDDKDFTLTRRAVLLATLLAAVNNIVEFFFPTVFYSAVSGLHIVGRSAGFYVNANIAGEAIVLGLLFSFAIVPDRFKVVFLFLTFVGIGTTFSRMGLLGWMIVVFFFIKDGVIKKDKAIVFLSAFAVALVLLTPKIYSYLSDSFGRDAANLTNRLDFFSGESSGLDRSQSERLSVAKAAFEAFSEHPFAGAGLGYTEHWEHRVSTHNMYLLFMAQFGILGVFLYPLLIYSAAGRSRGEVRKLAGPFAVYLLLIGLTTHNVLDAYHLLIGLALMSNMSYRSYREANRAA